MDLTLQVNNEKVNSGRVYLYVTGRVLKAYELSAFILTRCFPDIELSEEINRQTTSTLYAASVDVDFVTENEDYQIWVDNDCIEMQILNTAIKLKIPEWIKEFTRLKEHQQADKNNPANPLNVLIY